MKKGGTTGIQLVLYGWVFLFIKGEILNDYCIEDTENYMGESRRKIEETIIECFKDMDKESIESEINRYSKYLDKIIEMWGV